MAGPCIRQMLTIVGNENPFGSKDGNEQIGLTDDRLKIYEIFLGNSSTHLTVNADSLIKNRIESLQPLVQRHFKKSIHLNSPKVLAA